MKRQVLKPEMKRAVAKVARQVVSAQVEQKTGVSGSYSTLFTAPPIALMLLAQGSGENQRVGNEVHLDRIMVRGLIEFIGATPAARVICVRTKKPTAPVLTALTAYPFSTAYWTDNDVMSVVFDRTFYKDPSTCNRQAFKFDIAGRNAKVRFDGTGTSPEWNYWLYGVASLGSDTTSTLCYASRINFRDP